MRQKGVWKDGYLEYSDPVVTDDRASIYITNQAEQREILRVLRGAAESLPEGHVLVAGMWPSADELTQPSLMSDFDPRGIDDAFGYLGCF